MKEEETLQFVSVVDFCKEYDEAKATQDSMKVANVLNGIIAGTYLPILSKKDLIRSTIAGARKDEDATFILDSHQRYIGYLACIICAYTKLDFAGRLDGSNMFDNYDELQSRGLITKIQETIGSDIQEFTNIYNMMWDDYLAAEKSPVVMLVRLINGVTEMLKEENFTEIAKKLGELAEKLPDELKE